MGAGLVLILLGAAVLIYCVVMLIAVATKDLGAPAKDDNVIPIIPKDCLYNKDAKIVHPVFRSKK